MPRQEMTEREMFEASFRRPKNYFKLPPTVRWDIDASLGILEWKGQGLSEEDIARLQDHYDK